MSTLCSDNTGTIPILWRDEELIRLTGRTVYDLLVDDTHVLYISTACIFYRSLYLTYEPNQIKLQVGDGDKFPPILKDFEKKNSILQ